MSVYWTSNLIFVSYSAINVTILIKLSKKEVSILLLYFLLIHYVLWSLLFSLKYHKEINKNHEQFTKYLNFKILLLINFYSLI